jgi:DNA-binding beta-propeller fold protein YncE
MRTLPKVLGFAGVFALLVSWPAAARALTAKVLEAAPSQTGQVATFKIAVEGAMGQVQVRWDFGDETGTEFTNDNLEQSHTYAKAGHYTVVPLVTDGLSLASPDPPLVHAVYEPLTAQKPTASSDLVYDQASRKLYVANNDNDSVSAVDASGMATVGELAVSRGPVALALAPQSKLWVLHREAHAITIVDTATFSVSSELMLPYASQPMGLALSPTGDVAYVTLMALGKLLKLDVATGAVLGEVAIGPTARGVSVSADGAQVYVTRFITDDEMHGEVVRVGAATLTVDARFALATDTTTEDTDQKGRGLPNYLFSVGLSPDGLWGWVPGKKDNIYRGPFRDGLTLNRDNTVRPMLAFLDLAGGMERVERRVDLDDRSLPSEVIFSPLGDYAFVSVTGSATVEVRDAYTGGFVTALKETGIAPRGLVLTEDNKLFVHASLSRKLAVYDVAAIVSSADRAARRVGDIVTVATDKIDPQVLRGKQVFFNASDIRMSDPGYITCASCHFDGAEDGRVWDFGGVGEGLRNSVSLLGRQGMSQGNVNWSGSFDEIQDADDNIRAMFGGTGFLSPEQLAVGTVGTPLGDKKAGLSPELDALAAFLGSLDQYHPSPFRNSDGTLTADGVAGRAIFKKLGCGFCHTGGDATDSAKGKLHDVGTLKTTSGTRAGQPLLGIDTPSLNGVWETPPYLHDGSAATLRDVLTTANPDDRHAFTSALSEDELNQLVSYVQQLDGTVDEPVLGGSGAGGSNGGVGGTAGSSMSTAGTGGTAPPDDGGGCSVVRRSGSRAASFGLFSLLAGLAVLVRRRRRA